MTTTIDQKKYLKKYLSSKKVSKKRKKDNKKNTRIKIIDDDLDMATFNEAVTEDLTGGEIEDAPQIVGVMDERPPELRVSDYKTEMWKSVTVLDSDEEDDDMKARRKREREEKDFSLPRIKIEPNDSGNSPPRGSEDNSPPRKHSVRRNDDNSPPRQRKTKYYSSDDHNPLSRTTNQNSKDNSPPRQRKKKNFTSGDNSPPRKSSTTNAKVVLVSPPRTDNSSRRNYKDDSPSRGEYTKKSNERKSTQEDGTSRKRISRWNTDDPVSEYSPPRNVANSTVEDISPPRHRNNKNEDCSLSSRNLNRKDDDISPPRKDLDYKEERRRKHKNDNIDNSPRRKDETYKDDHGRNRRKQDRNIPSTSKNKESESSNRKNRDYSSTFRLGDHEKDISPRKRNESRDLTSSFRDEVTSSSGNLEVNLNLIKNETPGTDKVPKTIVRDRKTGRIRNLQEEAAAKKEKKRAEEEKQEKYNKWGKGLKQVEDANEKRAQDLHEMQKPLARYADDVDLEDMLRNREREGDPMLEYLRKKKREKAKNDPNAKPEKLKFEGDYGPPNRYGIKPGYRWDGVNRSNGYENKYFEVQNARRAHQTESYKWSSEDM